MAATLAVTILTSARYRSEGKLYVGLGRGNTTLDPTATVGQPNFVALPPSREDEINSVVQILSSRLLAEKVVDELVLDSVSDEPKAAAAVGSTESTANAAVALQPAWPTTAEELWQRLQPFDAVSPREKAIKELQARLSVGSVKKSMIINLSYEASSPEKAQAVLDRLIDAYLDQHSRLTRAPKSHEFLTNQAKESQGRLTKLEDALREIKSESSVASIPEQQRIFESRMGSLQDKLFETEALLKESSAEVADLEATLKDLPKTLVTAQVAGHSNEAADLMRQQLFALELREKELLTKYTEDVVLVQDIRRQIAQGQGYSQ